MLTFDYRSQLKEILATKQQENPHYSGRAFARDLGISVTALHGVLTKTRHLARNNLELIASKLNWSMAQLNMAFESTKLATDPTKTLLEDDQFKAIADWVHLAILNLAKIKNVPVTSVAFRLGLDAETTNAAISRLQRLGYICIDADNCLQRQLHNFGVAGQVPSPAIQAFHWANLGKAQAALVEVPLEMRDFLTIAAPTSLEKIPEIKKMIQEFRKQILTVFETDKADQVYFLNLQLYPVTRSGQGQSSFDVQTLQEHL